MGKVEFEEIDLFCFMVFIIDKDKKKLKKSEPLGFGIFLKKGNQKEHIPTQETLKIEININLY